MLLTCGAIAISAPMMYYIGTLLARPQRLGGRHSMTNESDPPKLAKVAPQNQSAVADEDVIQKLGHCQVVHLISGQINKLIEPTLESTKITLSSDN